MAMNEISSNSARLKLLFGALESGKKTRPCNKLLKFETAFNQVIMSATNRGRQSHLNVKTKLILL